MLAGYNRTADDRLVNIAEAHVKFSQQSVQFLRGPRRMAYFDDEGIIVKLLGQASDVRGSLWRVVKRERELNEDGAKAVCISKHVKASANAVFVIACRRIRVGEFLPEFGSEQESGIERYLVDPALYRMWAKRLIERCIDFDGIKILR